MAENRSQVKKDDICQKWQEMDFRAFHVVAIEVARLAMVENGRKWQKMGCRGYLVGNGFRALFAPFPYYCFTTYPVSS